jgi:hypothetical protein
MPVTTTSVPGGAGIAASTARTTGGEAADVTNARAFGPTRINRAPS